MAADDDVPELDPSAVASVVKAAEEDEEVVEAIMTISRRLALKNSKLACNMTAEPKNNIT